MGDAESASVTTGPADDAMRRAFGDALEEAMRLANVSAGVVAAHVTLTDDAVRKWVGGRSEPPPLTVFAVEDLLGVSQGDLSRHLGYVPVGAVSVTAAIDSDPLLSERDKGVLRSTYRSLRA